MTCFGIKKEIKNSTIVVIAYSFSHNSLGKEGAEFLCSVLPSLPNLTSVRLEFSHIYFTLFSKSCFEVLKWQTLFSFPVLAPESLVWPGLRRSQRPCCSRKPSRALSERHTHGHTLYPYFLFRSSQWLFLQTVNKDTDCEVHIGSHVCFSGHLAASH